MKTVLVREADKEYYNDMLPAELMFLLGDPDMILLGVVDETEKGAVPAALMILSAASEKQPVLEWLYVKEEYRGRGIGEDLMLQAFELAKQGRTGVLYAKLRLTKESPKKGKKDRDGFSAELYGQRDWLDSFGFYWDESQDNEWMFFVADMIDAKPEIFDKKNSNIKSFGALSKTIRGKFIKRIAEAYGSEISEAIDPDASFSEKHARSDYGQKAVYYWTEDGNRIRCCERGDIDYILDDPDSELFEQMWDEIAGYFEPIS